MASFVTSFTGLGEVSESLVKDDSLTPADFCYKQDVSTDICTSQQAASYDDCLTSSKIVDCDKFKTPLTSKYKNNNISETPCLFSQDESITHTPISSKWFVFVQNFSTMSSRGRVGFIAYMHMTVYTIH